jgi:two-component system phosphate regulon response regulator PhoB
MSSDRILAIEDEEDILEVIEYNLDREGFEVTTSTNGEDGFQKVRNERPDLVLLDLMLPDRDGLEICRKIRDDDELKRIPVIMVTAKDTESEVVLGLGVGADDYVTKPFNPQELVARVKAVLRRRRLEPDNGTGETIERGPLTILPERHKVLLDGEELDFTATEFSLLQHLADNPGRVYNRNQLIDHVLGTVVTPRNIDVHIRAIREKLGEHSDLIETVRGVGYRFRDLDD